MMGVEARPASAEPLAPLGRRSPMQLERALSADTEPRTLAARKLYPEEHLITPKFVKEEDDAPLDLSIHSRKEITVREFARHSFADPADYMRAQVILRQSRDFLAAGRDSGTESDDSAGRLSPGNDAISGKAYKKSLMKRYSKSFKFKIELKLMARKALYLFFKNRYMICIFFSMIIGNYHFFMWNYRGIVYNRAKFSFVFQMIV